MDHVSLNQRFIKGKYCFLSTNANRQMGLCYESLGQRQMASEANRQAWKALLQQRDRALELDLSTRINSEVTAARHDHIGRTLRQARVKLGITTSVDPLGEIQGRMRGNSFKGRVTPTTGEERFSLFSSPAHVTAEGGTTNEKLTQRMPGSKRVIDSSPTGCNNENKTALSTPGPFSEGRQDCPSPRSLMEKYSDRGRVVHEDGASKAEAMAAEAAARTLGFELWHKVHTFVGSTRYMSGRRSTVVRAILANDSV